MILFKTKTTFLLSIFLFGLTSCATIFENSYDVMARQALLDLVKTQNIYHKKYGNYTNQISELLKLDLIYNNGRVYLEIHNADKNDYRAISLPAESTTARVFIYDTSQGGFYEADEVEVSKYVLGALNFIRGEKEKQKTTIVLSIILIASLAILGLRYYSKYKKEENHTIIISYFTSLIPLGWAVSALNSINTEIFYSSKILIFSLSAIALCLVTGFTSYRWIKNQNLIITPVSVLALAGCTIFIALSSLATLIYTLLKYYPL